MTASQQCVIVYMTARDEGEARKIGQALVESRLAACVNLLGSIRSLYWWAGELQDEGEVALIAKTTADLVDALVKRVKEIHSYTCPCIVAIPIINGNPDFLKWLRDEAGSEE